MLKYFLLVLVILSCGKLESPKSLLNIEDGADGSDGKIIVEEQKFQVIGNIGTYVYHGDDNRAFNLTCMLGESNSTGYTVLRIISGDGGLIEIEHVGNKKETLYLPANTAIYLYTNYSGTFKAGSKTKACNP